MDAPRESEDENTELLPAPVAARRRPFVHLSVAATAIAYLALLYLSVVVVLYATAPWLLQTGRVVLLSGDESRLVSPNGSAGIVFSPVPDRLPR